MVAVWQVTSALFGGCLCLAWAKLTSFTELRTLDDITLNTFFKVYPSLKSWNTVDTEKRFSITSMVVDHSSSTNWFVKSLHEKYSIGWNRTQKLAFSGSPIACNIRFFGVGLESTLEGFQTGGTGYLTIGFLNAAKREMWHGFDKNETNKIHCYYKTTKDTGSEFLVCCKLLVFALVLNLNKFLTCCCDRTRLKIWVSQ